VVEGLLDLPVVEVEVVAVEDRLVGTFLDLEGMVEGSHRRRRRWEVNSLPWQICWPNCCSSNRRNRCLCLPDRSLP